MPSVNLRYFASLREQLGTAEERTDLPPQVTTIGQLRDWLADECGHHALKDTHNLRCALNQKLDTFDATVNEGDEVAFFPPLTGG